MIDLTRLAALVAVVGCGFGCAGSTAHGPGPLRFHNQDPITLVNDRKPLATPPPTFEEGLVEYYFKGELVEPTRRALTIGDERPAANVNSLGEVPDSAWFQRREVTPEELRRGPGRGGPDRSKPWRVVGVKIGGMALGLLILDGRDERYFLKFDERNFPESETSADVIVQRLTWGFGYNVPENEVVTFKREQLVLDPSAVIKNQDGSKRPMTQADLDRYLAAPEQVQGTYRGLVSRFVDGKVIGGIEPDGVRKDDLNDRVPHDQRRDLRGLRVLWAWVNHADLKSHNALASVVKGNYVKWFMLDFGDSLGVTAASNALPRFGYRRHYAPSSWLVSFVTLGLYVHPWERKLRYPDYRGLGEFESEHFDPATWTANHPWRPTDIADRFDQFWAAEIMMRFTPAHIRAAVEAGQYTDRRTTEYVIQTLIERQHKLGRWALARVGPITKLEVRERAGALTLCFDDLWLRHGFGSAGATHYTSASYDHGGMPLARGIRASADPTGRSCLPQIRAGTTHEGYTIVRIDIRRGDAGVPPVFVHVARGAKGVRVIGIDRR